MQTLQQFHDAAKELQSKYGFGEFSLCVDSKCVSYIHSPDKGPEIRHAITCWVGLTGVQSIISVMDMLSTDLALEMMEVKLKEKVLLLSKEKPEDIVIVSTDTQ